MIEPHGGRLVDRTLRGLERERALAEAQRLPVLVVDEDEANEVQNLARGVFSPLEGFMGSAEVQSVVARGALPDGTVWTIPILLGVGEAEAPQPGTDVALARQGADGPLAILHVTEVFQFDRDEAAAAVFGTTDRAHPGVARLQGRKALFVAGQVDLLTDDRGPHARYNLFPRETRELFAERGWRTVVAFQTRNVPHAGHEDLQKTVLGLHDGLLIQPLVGRKKAGDFRDEAIVAAYEVLIRDYFNPDRVRLNVLPTEMRYAGPQEAILHAIMRQNYGCTHIIIGRDHAGVNRPDGTPYYGEEEAIDIFDAVPDLGIRPVVIRGDFWFCRRCARVASDRTCPHGAEDRISFSGTRIRRMVVEGTAPPPEIMRPEVFSVIRSFPQPFVE